MDLPATSDTWVWQENARLPSMCTMHAPHSPAPQPNLVPVSLSSSLMIHNRGVVCAAADEAGFPFFVKSVDMFASPADLLCHVPARAQISSRNIPKPSAAMLVRRTCAATSDPQEFSFPLPKVYANVCTNQCFFDAQQNAHAVKTLHVLQKSLHERWTVRIWK